MSARDPRVDQALAWLERRGSKKNRDGMARYGIVADKVFGVSAPGIRQLASRFGRDHELALALWDTGWYEARVLTAFVDEPKRVTPAQMNRWAGDFDNWAICDALCFHLFDRTPHAWRKVEEWAERREEFVRRAAFSLLAALGVHDKRTGDEPFLKSLPLIERAATDDRHIVKKGVSWALRVLGKRDATLHSAALRTATRLSESSDAASQWVGRDALRDLTRPAVRQRFSNT